MAVHISEKGVFFHVGNGGSFVKRDLIRSISFEDRDGLHLFVLRGQPKRDKEWRGWFRVARVMCVSVTGCGEKWRES